MRAAQSSEGKACAELHALDSGHAEQDRGQAAFHAVEHRAADTGRQADSGALDDTADRILFLTRFLDSGQHGFERTRIVHRIFGVPQRIQLLSGDFYIIKRHILNLGDGLDVRTDRHTLLLEPQLAQRTGKH